MLAIEIVFNHPVKTIGFCRPADLLAFVYCTENGRGCDIIPTENFNKIFRVNIYYNCHNIIDLMIFL